MCKSVERWLVVLCALCVMCTLVACGPMPVEIPDAEYGFKERTLYDESSGKEQPIPGHDKWKGTKLKLDREKGTLTFTLADGKEMSVSFTSAPRTEWLSGCPTNFSRSQIELLTLGKSLEINGTTFTDPVLVGDCRYEGPQGANPGYVYLRDRGSIDTNSLNSSCGQLEKCFSFSDKPNCDPSQGPCN